MFHVECRNCNYTQTPVRTSARHILKGYEAASNRSAAKLQLSAMKSRRRARRKGQPCSDFGQFLSSATWRSNLRFLTRWKARNKSSGKKKMLILCHGHEHAPILRHFYHDHDVILSDIRATKRPDIVINIYTQLDRLMPYGPFNIVAFIAPPYDVYVNTTVRRNVSRLLHPHTGVVMFHDTEASDNQLWRCKYCHCVERGIFLPETKQFLYSPHPVTSVKICKDD